MTKISVIVSVYNQEKYIGRCLRSLFSQTISEKDYEVIIIDDGSIDNTLSVISNFKKNIRLIKNKENIGLPASLNKGIKASNSPYIVRVDADDYVNEKFLMYLSDFISENPSFDAVSSDYLVVDDKEEILKREDSLSKPIACGIMFRIEQLIDIGLYNEDFLYREEEELRKRFETKYKIHRIPMPLYRYRRHQDNMTNNLEKMKMYKTKLENS